MTKNRGRLALAVAAALAMLFLAGCNGLVNTLNGGVHNPPPAQPAPAAPGSCRKTWSGMHLCHINGTWVLKP